MPAIEDRPHSSAHAAILPPLAVAVFAGTPIKWFLKSTFRATEIGPDKNPDGARGGIWDTLSRLPMRP